ncbi:predicted protein [Botrytis cinerea T4]|uniref:Uncharacterized protein n=1 Tax=Botryotinia fuckeliana (strain T4) TaxID=999810 RepID=G2YA86_BOTF4|nr:predicted protein [Botrytis cinerea T4]
MAILLIECHAVHWRTGERGSWYLLLSFTLCRFPKTAKFRGMTCFVKIAVAS